MEQKKIPVKKNYETLEFWKGQIGSAKENLRGFHDTGDKIVRLYRDADREKRGLLESHYAVLYSNTETILPILFSEKPDADVRAQDSTSMPARQAAKMMENFLNYDLKKPETYDVIEACVKDLLLPGMGTLRVKYKPYFEERETEVMVDDEVEIEKEDIVAYECIEYCYTYWKDIIFPKCKRWNDLPWLAFRGLYTYEEAVDEFGKKKADSLEYNFHEEGEKNADDKFGKAEVWEIWFKQERKVIWISETNLTQEPIAIEEDPLELDGFYPVPKPLFSCQTNDTIEPVALFVQYQDLANELNDVSTRIRRIVDNLRRRGVYDAAFPVLEQMAEAADNVFIGVKDFARMQEKGGLKAILDTEDTSKQIEVLVALYQQRQQIIQAIYEVMGYADILRGVSDPRETASAQRIKGRFGTLRVSRFQREVQRFIRDAVRIAGEIVANKFDPKTIALVTGVSIQEVARYQEILKQTEPASVLIDIQTDSTVAADDIADKEEMVEFTRAISEFIAQSQAMYEALGLVATSELLLTMLRRFKMGRDIEQAVHDRVAELAQKEAEAKNSPPPPTIEQQMLALEQQKLAQQAQKDQATIQVKMLELRLKDQEQKIEMAKIGLEDQRKNTELDFKGLELAIKEMATVAEAKSEGNDFVGV